MSVNFLLAASGWFPKSSTNRNHMEMIDMASNAFANVKGSVFRTEHRSGIAKKTGQPYNMDILHILVPEAGLTELVLPTDRGLLGGVVYGQDDEVDFLVEIRRNEFGFGMTIIRDELVSARARSSAAA